MRRYPCHKEALVVALTHVQAAERPEMAEMQCGEDLAVAKLRIRQYFWHEAIDHTIELDSTHMLSSLTDQPTWLRAWYARGPANVGRYNDSPDPRSSS